eukprot:CAMPEP_0176413006 /NCGR_PEP_ID=MMETSP0127-20121128/4456_1 /TAXON_ID=938130 /ORGANISM="Platyophrya macrostoma, Strain WH" /LENGTH=1009 /DNA_ID=CAMNT_0017792733 /DNA_START=50 /DNA_END=3080 /DNA_ORIENTATION=+
MGIPKFASWLTKKFPAVVSRDAPISTHGLYLDMNGIIHPCCHSEDDPSISRRTDAEKMYQVCLCVEQLVEAVRPTDVLYLAMDGVAPRAKMNQQRARRYMAAVDAFGSTVEEHRVDNEAAASAGEGQSEEWMNEAVKMLDLGVCGVEPPRHVISDSLVGVTGDAVGVVRDPSHTAEHRFDSNGISPGTEFMTACSERVREFVEERISRGSALWRNLCVVYSDTNSPGEGEHKLIDFLRVQITSASEMPEGALFRRGTRSPGATTTAPTKGHAGSHVICGLDADLILLCLSLHVNDVVIMRDVKRQSTFLPPSGEGAGGSVGGVSEQRNLRGSRAVDDAAPVNGEDDEGCPLRNETLHQDAAAEGPNSRRYEYFSVDAIGDAIVSEMQLFIKFHPVPSPSSGFLHVSSSSGYTYSQKVCDASMLQAEDGSIWYPTKAPFNHKIIDDFIAMATLMGNDFVPRVPSAFCGEAAMDNLLETYIRCVLPHGFLTKGQGDFDLRQLGRLLEGYGNVEIMLFRQEKMRSGQCDASLCIGAANHAPVDKLVRRTYYESTSLRIPQDAWRCGDHLEEEEWCGALEKACSSYIEGLRFVWQYYSCTSVACSWSWGYAFHHAPFAVDLAQYLKRHHYDPSRIVAPEVDTQPPLPFAQLMCILPPTSCALLPKCLGDVMCSGASELAETFPSHWMVDYSGSEGKEHLTTVLLPFADMRRLVEIVREHETSFSDAERTRNQNRLGHLVICHASQLIGANNSDALTISNLLHGMDTEVAHVTTSTRHSDVSCVALRDTLPNAAHRPKTYSSTIPTRVGSNVDPKIRRFRRENKSDDGKSTSSQRPPTTSTTSTAAETPGIVFTPPDVVIAGAAFLFVSLAILTTTQWFSLLAALECLVVTIAMGGIGVLCLVSFGIVGAGRSAPRAPGCALRRNVIRDTFLDWLCLKCLSRNFMKNDQCFLCHAPAGADDSETWALFSSRLTKVPPSFEADHTPHLVRVRIPVTCPVLQSKKETSDPENCDML